MRHAASRRRIAELLGDNAFEIEITHRLECSFAFAEHGLAALEAVAADDLRQDAATILQRR
jgi:hypothetical protein